MHSVVDLTAHMIIYFHFISSVGTFIHTPHTLILACYIGLYIVVLIIFF